VSAPGNQQRKTAGEMLNKSVCVPHPACEEAEADDMRRKGLGRHKYGLSVLIKAAGGGIDHLHFATSVQQGSGDILQTEERRSEPFR
jgi:hypothetical protein